MASLLYRPDQKELMSLSKVMRTQDGRVMLTLLKSELVTTQKLMIDADKDVMKFQGRARFLTDFITLLEEQAKKDVPLS